MSQSLRQALVILCANFQIPTEMMELGINLLDRSIDFERSNQNTLTLRLDGNCHFIGPNDRCEHAVYLLIKNVGDEQVQLSHPFSITDTVRLYGGQTNNFRRREGARRNHPMANSDVKICLCHCLTAFQKDCLELALIGYLLLKFGLKVANKCIYPMHTYSGITADIDIFDVESHARLEANMISTYGLMRRVLIVGTAPPQRLLGNPAYARCLREWQVGLRNGGRIANPLLDWDEESQDSRSIRELRGWFESDDGDLPDFINHYPEVPSGNFSELYRTLDLQTILQADRQVRKSAQILEKDIIVMLGARPTRLYPRTLHHGYFFAGVCAQVDLHWLSTERCALVLWWPDHGLRNHSHRPSMILLEQVWVLLAHKLHLIIYLMHLASPSQIGVTGEQVQEVVRLLNRAPTSIQLDEMLKRLNMVWMADRLQDVGIIAPFQYQVSVAQAASDQVKLPVELPEDDQQSILNSALLGQAAEISLYDTIRNWSKANSTRINNLVMDRHPTFQAMSEAEQVRVVREAAVNESNRMVSDGMTRYIEQGLFEVFPGEDATAQRQRWQRQINIERISRPHSDVAGTFTCPWCGQVVIKQIQEGGKLNIGTRLPGCPVGVRHILGWSLVPGNHQGYFPQNNVFLDFFHSLPPITVVNNWQLAVTFAEYLLQVKEDNPQADFLCNNYEDMFPTLRTFKSNRTFATKITTFMRSLETAMGRLKQLNPPCDVHIRERAEFPIEKANFRRSGGKKTLFGIKLQIEGQPFLLSANEDYEYQGYQQVLERNTNRIFSGAGSAAQESVRRGGRIGGQRRGGQSSSRGS